MKATEYQSMAELEESYWWHIGRIAIVDQQLKRMGLDPKSSKILNIGCGTGGTIPVISKYGKVINVDVSDDAIKYAKRKGIKNIHKVDDIKLPFEDGEFDCVIALDVLEHIEDDLAALKEWQRVSKPGGRLLITSPAYEWLWSEHDESLHHIRRYTLSGVHRIVDRAGWLVTKRSYMIVFSFPLIVGYRFMRSLVPTKEATSSYVVLPRPINGFFVLLLKLEAKMLKAINFPLGTSVLIIGKKPKAD